MDNNKPLSQEQLDFYYDVRNLLISGISFENGDSHEREIDNFFVRSYIPCNEEHSLNVLLSKVDEYGSRIPLWNVIDSIAEGVAIEGRDIESLATCSKCSNQKMEENFKLVNRVLDNMDNYLNKDRDSYTLETLQNLEKDFLNNLCDSLVKEYRDTGKDYYIYCRPNGSFDIFDSRDNKLNKSSYTFKQNDSYYKVSRDCEVLDDVIMNRINDVREVKVMGTLKELDKFFKDTHLLKRSEELDKVNSVFKFQLVERSSEGPEMIKDNLTLPEYKEFAKQYVKDAKERDAQIGLHSLSHDKMHSVARRLRMNHSNELENDGR